MQYYHRGTVVGRPTKGYVQGAKSYYLPGGGCIWIPESNYIGLDGKQMEGRGVIPDVIVPAPTLASLRVGRDLDVEAALQIMNEEKNKKIEP